MFVLKAIIIGSVYVPLCVIILNDPNVPKYHIWTTFQNNKEISKMHMHVEFAYL